MRSPQNTATALESLHVPVQAKLAAAWTSFMFLYVYVDIIGFYLPGTIDDILVGVVFEFDITQVWAITVLTLMAIPILMVVLSAMLPARASRITNLVVATLYIPVSIFNAVGESWTYYYWLAVVLEVIVLAVILRSAWTWPRTASPATTATTADRGSIRLLRRAGSSQRAVEPQSRRGSCAPARGAGLPAPSYRITAPGRFAPARAAATAAE